MIQIVDPRIEQYLKELYDDGDVVRREMEALAQQRTFPIVGPLAGRHLRMLAQAIRAKRVFELGSGYGYSAFFFAQAVGEDGSVHCTDHSAENVQLAQDFLGRAGLWPRVTYHCGEATAALAEVGGTWDIIYNDIDKRSYPEVIELACRHLRSGGLFISDNALWQGRVLEAEDDHSEATASIVRFNQQLLSHPRFLTSIDPIRDGLAVALKVD